MPQQHFRIFSGQFQNIILKYCRKLEIPSALEHSKENIEYFKASLRTLQTTSREFYYNFQISQNFQRRLPQNILGSLENISEYPNIFLRTFRVLLEISRKLVKHSGIPYTSIIQNYLGPIQIRSDQFGIVLDYCRQNQISLGL